MDKIDIKNQIKQNIGEIESLLEYEKIGLSKDDARKLLKGSLGNLRDYFGVLLG